MKYEMSKLDKGLEALTGYDFENAEKEARSMGDTTPDISFSKNFQARLAAVALGVKVEDIKSLKMNEFVMATTKVSNFLFGSLVESVQADATKK